MFRDFGFVDERQINLLHPPTKSEKHLFVFFYIQVYLTSVRILVFGSLLIYFMFLVWESFFNGVVLPAERFFFRIRWVGFMGFVPRY